MAARFLRPTDLLLAMSVSQGDAVSLEAFVQAYRPVVQRAATRYVRNREDAEEVANDALFKAIRAIGTYKGEAALASWVHRVTFSVAMSFLRQHRRRLQANDERCAMEATRDALDLGGTQSSQSLGDQSVSELPDAPIRFEQLESLIARHIARMPAGQATVARRVLLNDERPTDVASDLGIRLGTVKSQLHRARTVLRPHLRAFHAS